ncbi:hypothetical protein [Paenibacillus hamazuiensis]|nr:hypothetical protein [Paenibacillus hamazuiensis]
MNRYNFYGIPMEVYLMAGLFAAALAVIVYFAYREAAAPGTRRKDAGGKR